MGKVRRGNYSFVTWIGDHDYHVHVRKAGREVLKWDLEKSRVIKGRLTKRLLKIIRSLVEEGLL